MSALWSKILQGLEDKDERSISALNEALEPKQMMKQKVPAGVTSPCIKKKPVSSLAKVAL
jgi:hypothetical protein